MTVPALAVTEPVGPAGAPLLLLGPSLGTSTILWDEVAAQLSETWRVAAWDLPGHGASPKATAAFTVADLADGVADAAARLGASRILYAGVSLGGAVGLELMLRHPDLVAAASIICSGAKIAETAGWHDRAAHVRAQSTSSLVVPSAQRWFAPESLSRHPVITGRLLHALQDADDESYALCCEALAAHDVRDRLGRITAPVLAVFGHFDQVCPEASAVEIARGVQNGDVAEVLDAAHLAPAEDPDLTARLLRDFFTGSMR
ncbi:alpha/beta fold hydrolase [Microbacterium horticulturae]|uniref:Alpha/beta fold hydrolase n=1 Tax=Microbacterium horticulturae TaxID=3028316 RepID=A0ABY8BX14_9MICO|nr:alpha/beta fold hydrolase [Microbacterium sp. KACC 23027]WEG08427.1 alpha/beta fold hydrolase [Microbacterium sp. KACC 23027]